jgi:hypothetical protein
VPAAACQCVEPIKPVKKVERLLLKMTVRLGPMTEGIAEAHSFANPLRTTHSNYGTMGADSRDVLGEDVCGCGRNFDLPTSSIKLVSASFSCPS